MSMLQVDIRLPELQTLARIWGWSPEDPHSSILWENIARRITKYVPSALQQRGKRHCPRAGAEKWAHCYPRAAHQVFVFRQGDGGARAETDLNKV